MKINYSLLKGLPNRWREGRLIVPALASLSVAFACSAADSEKNVPKLVQPDQVKGIVSSIVTLLNERYPVPAVSSQYERALKRELEAGRYFNATPCQLAQRLTADLQSSHLDKHLAVTCGAETASGPIQSHESPEHVVREVTQYPELRAAYIRLSGPWALVSEEFEDVASAMALAAGSRYVILDIRGNPGGHGELGDFVQSYFFPLGEGRTLLQGLHRDGTRDAKLDVYPFVPGRRLPNAEVLVLVNGDTASAAEGLAFGLQKAHRALIIGQKTAGAGIAGRYEPLGHDLTVIIPDRLIVAAGTQAGWEGTGVAPDITAAEGGELDAALSYIRKNADTTSASAPRFVDDFGGPLITPPSASPDNPLAIPANYGPCVIQSTGTERDEVLWGNRCSVSITLQYMSSIDVRLVNEVILRPRQSFITGSGPDRSGQSWFLFVACKEGRYSNVPLSITSKSEIDFGQYKCVSRGNK